MDWNAVAAPPARISVARAFVELTPTLGVSRAALERASENILADQRQWRVLFPGGLAEVIWFISEISDASMLAAFAVNAAADMAHVIGIRLDQNVDMKAFVRKIMWFDVMHPFQALARMQRTARAMYGCLPAHDPAQGFVSLAALNLLYTALVFLWLLDGTPDDRRTKTATRAAMRLLGV